MIVKKACNEFWTTKVQPDVAETLVQEFGRGGVEVGRVDGIASSTGSDLVNALPVDVFKQVVVSGTIEVWS